MSSPTSPANAFEIGLVMAGAASAGAYTAGVIDFLVEALQEWEGAKRRGDPDVPDHDVRIRVAAGASAGGITAALLGMLPFTGHFPMRGLDRADDPLAAPNAGVNLLYRSWVRDVDVREMLATDDIAGAGPAVPSLLNGRVLGAVAESAVSSTRAAASIPSSPPSYLANPLQLYLALTNIQGLSYDIRMVSDGGVRGHRLRSHADYAHFAVFGAGAGGAEPAPPGASPLGTTPGGDDGWDRLRDAALATSAFPGGFPARPFRNPLDAYRHRGDFGEAEEIAQRRVSIDVKLPSQDDDSYPFWSVDGGLLDNEPLQLARKALAASRRTGDDNDARRVDHAVLLIDPFPNEAEEPICPFGDGPDFFGSLLTVVPILRTHVAFKPHELALALSEDIRSRFLVAPVRETMRPGEFPLASGGLAGFAGFVHPLLRAHDFQLGRRNCQKFLREHFSVHIENPLVAGWVARLASRPGALDPYFPESVGADGRAVKDRTMVQIVPLVGAVAAEEPLLPWPRLDRERDVAPLRGLIEARADAIVPVIARSLLTRLGVDDRRLLRRVLKAIACNVITGRLASAGAAAIERDLTTRNLM